MREKYVRVGVREEGGVRMVQREGIRVEEVAEAGGKRWWLAGTRRVREQGG